jgi:hypothetical protein
VKAKVVEEKVCEEVERRQHVAELRGSGMKEKEEGRCSVLVSFLPVHFKYLAEYPREGSDKDVNQLRLLRLGKERLDELVDNIDGRVGSAVAVGSAETPSDKMVSSPPPWGVRRDDRTRREH